MAHSHLLTSCSYAEVNPALTQHMDRRKRKSADAPDPLAHFRRASFFPIGRDLSSPASHAATTAADPCQVPNRESDTVVFDFSWAEDVVLPRNKNGNRQSPQGRTASGLERTIPRNRRDVGAEVEEGLKDRNAPWYLRVASTPPHAGRGGTWGDAQRGKGRRRPAQGAADESEPGLT